ncbi:selenocysteine-specific translation elongation factor [Dendrosporobacter sp. 1207_IL3150]|uniref:selenocysteine-specific translation elongation factor n=1 Tax=Dendrosporobacter sp. 1207_IL3150 TaxID=3084054 RepID=UPI002FD8F0C0
MKYIVFGTAGHVDHGKSALIKALTGVDTDRLTEEKKRGISIDLGFAAMELGDSNMAGIIDVPGHERYLKNMLAGSGSIDAALLVIAADEGIMPQTTEHLAMLNLYGIKHGLIVLNKVDKVASDWLELVQEEICEAVKDSFLENAPICHVSSTTGLGLNELRASMLKVAQTADARNSEAPFRLWIDRVFSVKGYGAVVTGTVLSGKIVAGNNVVLYPKEASVRVRGLETHGNKVEMVEAGQRAAINITGAEFEEIRRGMVLSSHAVTQVSTEWDVVVKWLCAVETGTRIRLHIGTGEFIGRIYKFKNSDDGYMKLILEEPIGAAAGDTGIIRLYSPQTLLGSVKLIGVSKRTRKIEESRKLFAQALNSENLNDIIGHALKQTSSFMTVEDLNKMIGFRSVRGIKETLEELEAENKIVAINNYYIDANLLQNVTSQIEELLRTYHKEFPEKTGISQELVKQQLKVSTKVFHQYLTYWQETNKIILSEGYLAYKQHAENQIEWEQDLLSKAEKVLGNNHIIPLNIEDFFAKLKLQSKISKAAFETLCRHGLLVKAGDMYVYRKTIQYIVDLLRVHFCNNSTLTVGEFRDMINTSRKYALPLLEYLDLHKYTEREGDIRRAGCKIS